MYLISGSLSSSISTSIDTHIGDQIALEITSSGTASITGSYVILPSVTGSEFVGSFQLDPNDPGSFYISGSNSSASLYMSSSGKLGFGTTNPESEFDIRTDDFKIRKRGKASGIRMNEDGNLESFNNDTNSAATGSEVILKYTRGAVKSNLRKRKEDLKDEEFYDKARAQTNDVLGSIRWVVDSGSLDHRKGGEAGNIKMQVATADVNGVTGKLSINIAADPGEEAQQLYSINGATQKHEFTGSIHSNENITAPNITANTAKTGITSTQTSAITANTAKTGITSTQTSAITANTAKTGISTAQANAITANTAKVGTETDLSITEGLVLKATVAESRGVYTLTFTMTTADGRTTKTANITMS